MQISAVSIPLLLTSSKIGTTRRVTCSSFLFMSVCLYDRSFVCLSVCLSVCFTLILDIKNQQLSNIMVVQKVLLMTKILTQTEDFPSDLLRYQMLQGEMLWGENFVCSVFSVISFVKGFYSLSSRLEELQGGCRSYFAVSFQFPVYLSQEGACRVCWE